MIFSTAIGTGRYKRDTLSSHSVYELYYGQCDSFVLSFLFFRVSECVYDKWYTGNDTVT